MIDLRQVTSALTSSLKQNIGEDSLSSKTEITQLLVGHESIDAGDKQYAETNLEKLNNVVEQTLSDVFTAEGIDEGMLTDAQMNAAVKIAGLAIDPMKTFSAMANPKPMTVDGDSAVITADMLGSENIDTGADQLALEAFDGQEMNNALQFSIVYNLLAARQDEFGETFYPTITADPTTSGAIIQTKVTSFYDDFSRNKDGSVDRSKFNRKPIVKALYDNELFSVNKNRIAPVLRAENQDKLVATLSFGATSYGKDVTSAPIKFNEEISLIGISQTDDILASGGTNSTDALDRGLKLEKVYFSIDGKDSSDNAITENFFTDVSALEYSNFTYTTQDHNKDLALSFRSDSLILNTLTGKTVNGSASQILEGFNGDYNIKLEINLHGDANTQNTDVVVFGSSIKLAEVKTTNGIKLSETSAEFLAIKAVFDTIKLTGYVLDAAITNSNRRIRGQLITSDTYTHVYTIGARSGFSVIVPTGNSGPDGDADSLSDQITLIGAMTSSIAVTSLMGYAQKLNNITNNGASSDVKLVGIAGAHVNTDFNEATINIADEIDSESSSERDEDIKSVLVNIIKNKVLNMYIESNYANAFAIAKGNMGGKPTVIIGTDPIIKEYLLGEDGIVNIGSSFDVKVVSTPNVLIKGKLVITFGTFGANRNTKPDELNFGQMFWTPTISTDIVRSNGSSVVRELSNIPHFQHVENLPVMRVINVNNISGALSKITRNYHTV